MRGIISIFYKVWPYTVALFTGLAVLRVYEFFHLEPEVRISFWLCIRGMGIDLLVSLLITGIFIFIQLLLNVCRVRMMLWIMVLLSLVALLTDFVLIQYFFATKVPLDEAIYFFSMQELRLIVGTENRVSPEVLLVIGCLLALYVLLIRGLKSTTPKRWMMVLFAVCVPVSFVCIPKTYVDAESDHKRALVLNNRLAYFVHRSVVYLLEDSGENSTVDVKAFSGLDDSFYGGKPVSVEYPLLHELPETSEFATFMNKSEKGAPNIVFIMVESLSTTLVGEKGAKTGNLLPFLDSLSKQSLYWPNFLSTCDRTHNVLPASLASVPYTTRGNMFQQLEFPNHWSLVSLLNSAYYTRFYCGVDLNFSNMNGYMNYYQTQYVVKHWEKQFSAKFSERDTPWGFPDGALFGKSWLDYRKQRLEHRKRLDAFLTISTHDPFVIPNEKHYKDLVLQRISKIRNPTATHRYVQQNAHKFAAFVYTDDQLRKYFAEAQKHPDFDNTIFLIYGDHGTELCLYDELSRYRIPLIIYSPLIKHPRTFQGVSTQLDLAPTLLNYLRVTYGMKLPSVVPFIGRELSYSKDFECKRSLVLGSVGLKGEHILHDGYFMYYHSLFKIGKGLQITAVKDARRQQKLSEQRKMCTLLSEYAIYGNKILPLSLSKSFARTEEFKQIYQYSAKQPSKASLREQFISIGDQLHLPQDIRYVRLQFECDYWNDHEANATNLPGLTLSLDHTVNGKSEQLVWKQIDYQVKDFRKQAWNHLSGTITLRLSDYPRLGKENLLKYYLLNVDRKYFNIRNVEVKVLRDRE